MLTEKHLAVVRAALKFLDEETSPHGTEALFHYLDSQGQASQVTVAHVADVRQFFDAVELSYAMVDSTGLVIESERLIPAASINAASFHSDLSLLAAVLVPVQ